MRSPWPPPAGVAIEHGRLHEATRRQGRWLEATREITTTLLLGAEPEGVLELIASRAGELSEAAVGVISLPAAGSEALVTTAVAGAHTEQIQGMRFPVDESIAGEVLRTGRAVRTDLSGDQPTQQPLMAIGGLGPAMCLPLTGRKRILGTLAVARAKGEPRFSDEDLRLAEPFATQAALAIEFRQLRPTRHGWPSTRIATASRETFTTSSFSGCSRPV